MGVTGSGVGPLRPLGFGLEADGRVWFVVVASEVIVVERIRRGSRSVSFFSSAY